MAVEAKATDAIFRFNRTEWMSENDELNSVIESLMYARTEQAKAVMAVMERLGLTASPSSL